MYVSKNLTIKIQKFELKTVQYVEFLRLILFIKLFKSFKMHMESNILLRRIDGYNL